MEDEKLTGLEPAFEITTMKKFAGKRTGVVLHKKMINGIAATHAANGLAAGDANSQGENIVGANIFDLRKVQTVFVSKWKITEKVFERVDAAFDEKFGALWTNTFDHLDIGLQAVRHKVSYSREGLGSTKHGG